MPQPLVSVLLPVYNGSRYLQEAVDSILAQQFSDFELIAVDDGSTDSSLDILRGYSDPRLVIVPQPENRGIVHTMNEGLKRCQGKYIARMDADDIAVPERFAAQIAYLEAHPEVGVLDTVMAYIDEHSRPLGRNNSTIISRDAIYNALPRINCLGHSSIMMRSDVLRAYPYRQIPYEDYDLWLRLASDGIGIAKLDRALLLFRLHGGSIVGQDHAQQQHFLKIIQTKRFYLSMLSFADSVKPFNVRVRAWLLRDMTIHAFKKLKSAIRS